MVRGRTPRCLELLRAQFQVRPWEESPNLGSEMRHLGLLMEACRNPKGLPCSGSPQVCLNGR